MDYEETKERCRVCLDENVDLHWNNALYGYSDMTYKDCYYKYTQLEYIDEDDFSTMLCRNCFNGLEYIEAFISKAIETHEILQKQFRFGVIVKDEYIKHEEQFETILVEETEFKPEIPNYPVDEDSSEQFLMIVEDTETLNRYDRRLTPLTHRRKAKMLNTAKSGKMEESNYEENGVTSEGSLLLDDKKCSKKMEQSICCSICSKVLASRYKAILHEKTHIKNRERNEACVECGLKFFSKGILRQHMLTHIENREKPHKCDFCDKAFYNKSGLNIHRRIHLGQMISCTLCKKEFFRQIDLDKHMNSHSAVRINSDIKLRSKCLVRCKHCGKDILSTSFKSHNAKHLNEPLFKCSICNKEFFGRSSCIKHLKNYHKKKKEDVINSIIAYKSTRLSRLFLEQNADIQSNEK